MKRLVLAVVISLALALTLAVSAQAQQWTTANQVTIGWAPITVPTGTVSYRVYQKPENGTVETLLTTVTTTRATITFTTEGRYFIGVMSVRSVDGIEVEATRIAWSNIATDVVNGATFGVQYYAKPAVVGGIFIPTN